MSVVLITSTSPHHTDLGRHNFSFGMAVPCHGLPIEVVLLALGNPEWKTWAFVYLTLFQAYFEILKLGGYRLMTISILKINVTWQKHPMGPEQNPSDQPEDDVHFSGKVSSWIYPNLDSIFHVFLAVLKSESGEVISFTFAPLSGPVMFCLPHSLWKTF